MKAILTVLLILAIVVSGCSLSAPGQNSTSNAPQVTTPGITPVKNEIVSKTPKTIVNDAKSSLRNILAASTGYKVAYDINAAGTTTQMTQYISGGKLRIDMSAGGLDVQTYYLNNSYIVCNKATGIWM
jgi:PBP1b-binding outer membrane lipoprotein LpoB